MTKMAVKQIAIFGNGLAGLLCALKLNKVLPGSVELTYVEGSESNNTDIFFGTVTPPATYDFLLSLGLTEPDILPATNTSFSLGTQYKNWGPDKRTWTQSSYRPLPAHNGVGFHHYLTKLRSTSPYLSEIEPYIMSVEAAKSGCFAHPPEGRNIPLKEIEYGYHFLPNEFCDLLSRKLKASRVKWLKADVMSAQRNGEEIETILLSNGNSLAPDFIIDALGAQSNLASPKPPTISPARPLKALSSFVPTEKIEGVTRVLSGKNYGWQSETPLQNGIHRLTVFAPESESEAIESHGKLDHTSTSVTLGTLPSPWTGNCLILGHGAAIIEPLTTAPILLLQRDIERLAELIPVSNKMAVESREYNRRFTADYEHAALFQRTFFVSDTVKKTPYFEAVTALPLDQKILDKVRQFKSRGILVQYDYEPFNDRDWTLLHLGMGRYPARYDPLANHIPADQLISSLKQMRAAIETMAKKMPPHHIYMTGLFKYLKEKHG